ncbi:MAG: UDP-3-O-(3-hydroxymyristoyl)glucosamine N-acyltransferase, partial [Gammaproteobacteria bacterium]
QPGQLSFLGNARYRRHLLTTKASAVILTAKEAANCSTAALIVDDPYLAYAKAATLFQRIPVAYAGKHPTAIIGQGCQIDKSVSVGAQCVIGNQVKIGANSIIEPGTIIGDEAIIGTDCHLWSRVSLYYRVQIGNRVVIHSGAVLGADGFGLTNEQGVWHRIPQLGGVVIGDEVEIGANTTIDRGALEDTIIEQGVKLDNLIQVAHNVHIGAHTAIAACVAIGGSTKIGKYCMIGGGATISGHLEITDSVIIIGTAVVSKSISEPGIYSSGTGLMPHREAIKCAARYRQLDDIVKRLKQLEKIAHESDGH